MSHKADGCNYIETCFYLWKCKDCNYHFAVESGNVCFDGKFKCPVCGYEHLYDEHIENFDIIIDYYSGD